MLENFLHKKQDDKRSMNEIVLTEKLTSVLTELNLKRIASQKPISQLSSSQVKTTENKKLKLLFVCICGIPAFQKQFESINLPGQRILIVLPGFQTELNQEQLKQRAYHSNLDQLSRQINTKIQVFPTDCQLIFVYHSYGSFIATYYFKNFYQQQKHRIKGIIQLGGAPIRVYPLVKPGIQAALKLERKFIEDNIDMIFQVFNKNMEQWKSKNVVIAPYRSKYSLQSMLLSYKTDRLNELFDMNRKLPGVVKLFIYGQNDTVFQTVNLDEKSVYFLYNKEKSLETEYQASIRQKYNLLHKQSPLNIQQKFIYKLKNGRHSLHMQKSLTVLIQNIINDYLGVIL